MVNFATFVVLLLLTRFATSATSFQCPALNGYYADPDDDRHYYQCQDGRAFQFTCPNGTYFIESIKQCNYKTVTVPPKFICPEPNGFYVDPKDPHIFYECVGGTYYEFYCPAGLVFDPTIKQCAFEGVTIAPTQTTTTTPSTTTPTTTQTTTTPTTTPTTTTTTPTTTTPTTTTPTPTTTTPSTTTPTTTTTTTTTTPQTTTKATSAEEFEALRLRIESYLYKIEQFANAALNEKNALLSNPQADKINQLKQTIKAEIANIEELDRLIYTEQQKSHTLQDKWFLEDSAEILRLHKKHLNELLSQLA